MAQNAFTQLYWIPASGAELTSGSRMDESLMQVPLISGSLGEVRRTRILLAGDNSYEEIVRVRSGTPKAGDYGLVVRPINDAITGTQVIENGTAQAESIDGAKKVVEYVASDTFYLTGLSATGDVPAKFNVYLSSGALSTLRTTASCPNVSKDFPYAPIKVSSGGSVGINVTNTINGVVGNFDATLTGYQA
jgi:hypothetical protein